MTAIQKTGDGDRDGHPHVEYHVGDGLNVQIIGSPAGALRAAMEQAISRGRTVLDVCIWSEDGARSYGGDDAVAAYREDPEASVFERFEIAVNACGRVP